MHLTGQDEGVFSDSAPPGLAPNWCLIGLIGTVLEVVRPNWKRFCLFCVVFGREVHNEMRKKQKGTEIPGGKTRNVHKK